MSTSAPSEPTTTPASTSRGMSTLPAVPTNTKIASSVPRPVIRATDTATAARTRTSTSAPSVPRRAAALFQLNPCTTNTATTRTPIDPRSVARSGSSPLRTAGRTARRNTAMLAPRPASEATPFQRPTATSATARRTTKGQSDGSRTITRGEHAHDVSVDDFDPDARVGIPARDDRRQARDEDDANEDVHLTWSVAPTVVVRPASSITLKTRE